MPIFMAIDPSVVNYTTFDFALKTQATRCGVSPYVIDRILWLISSGDYFKHECKIRCGVRKLRANFISELKAAISSKTVIL